ncbi:MAG: hypothetical protein K2H34_11075 [Lachnospiraceae bacterium]|nr:hypothetical protein [Lachnospiraceae bacterium]
MSQMLDYTNPEAFEISVEEFDALEGVHEFSTEYKRNKKKLLKEYRKTVLTSVKRNYAKVAVVAALAVISAPLIANAATGGEFFNRLWGNQGKKDVESHQEELFDEEKGTSCIVTYPKREYVDVEPEKAEALIGDNVSHEQVVKEFGDTKLTILSAVSDGQSAVVEFTLEREGGVNALNYSQLDNEAKGAWFSEETDFYFEFADYSGSIYVDMDKSTPDKLYCYDYMTADNRGKKEIILKTYEYPCTRGEWINADDQAYDEYMSKTKEEQFVVPLGEEVERVEYVNADGGIIQISPLSMWVDMGTGLGLTEREGHDSAYLYYIAIHYKDGSEYIIMDKNCHDRHSCDVEIDNTSYVCADLTTHITCNFNRLVDVDNIASITVNETEYTLE